MRAERLKRGWTQAEAAWRSGLGIATIERYERRKKPDVHASGYHLHRYLKIFGITFAFPDRDATAVGQARHSTPPHPGDLEPRVKLAGDSIQASALLATPSTNRAPTPADRKRQADLELGRIVRMSFPGKSSTWQPIGGPDVTIEADRTAWVTPHEARQFLIHGAQFI